ncbi:MAG: SPOR domain-containing protein [Gammaproteobacteria bacterium]
MSQESTEELDRFRQKLRNEGSDGFADGPRPWEHWDESGHQANNRIWEGSARRIYPRRRKTRSVGYRLLSALAFIALTTLMVGIGGVYFSHTQTQQLAQSTVPPLPATSRPVPSMKVIPGDSVMTATATQTNNPGILSAPASASGSGSTQGQAPEAPETVAAVEEANHPVTDEPVPAVATTVTPPPGTSPPVTGGSVDSVAIETVITEKSVTTTVYTRHPQQAEAEIVAAIETLPPPFAIGVAHAAQPAPDTLSPTVHISDNEAITTAASSASPAELLADVAETDRIDDSDTAVTDAAALTALPPRPATEAGEEASMAVAEPGNTTATPESLTAGAAEIGASQSDALPDTPAVQQAETDMSAAVTGSDSTTAALELLVETGAGVTGVHADALPEIQVVAVSNSTAATASPAAIVPETIDMQGDALPDNQAMQEAEAATRVATVEAVPATATDEVNAGQAIKRVQALTPVDKTGNWVINLASYTWKSTASRKLALFQQQGVDAEIFAVTINDKPMYRIRVTGYENSRQAKAGIPAIEKALDLEGAWISRR